MTAQIDTFGYPTRERAFAFYRHEVRSSRRTRLLDCGHRIDATEPYSYQVGKVNGEHAIFQRYDCDVCMRRGNSY